MPYQVVNPDSQIPVVQAALLPTGKVLIFGGSEHDDAQNLSGNAADLDNIGLFDPVTNGLTIIGSFNADVLCSGHAFLADRKARVTQPRGSPVRRRRHTSRASRDRGLREGPRLRCTGDFVGVAVTNCDRERRLHTRECGLEHMFARARKKRLRVAIEVLRTMRGRFGG